MSENENWKKMLRRVREAKFEESKRDGGSFFSRLFAVNNVDGLGAQMDLRKRLYTTAELLSNNITASDFVDKKITIAKGRELGYTLGSFLELPGFNTEVFRVMNIQHSDMYNEKSVVVQHPRIFKPILRDMFAADAQLIQKWNPDELFQLQFRDGDWPDIDKIWPTNPQDCTPWHASFANHFATPQRIRVTTHPGRAVGPQLHENMPRIKVNLSGLL